MQRMMGPEGGAMTAGWADDKTCSEDRMVWYMPFDPAAVGSEYAPRCTVVPPLSQTMWRVWQPKGPPHNRQHSVCPCPLRALCCGPSFSSLRRSLPLPSARKSSSPGGPQSTSGHAGVHAHPPAAAPQPHARQPHAAAAPRIPWRRPRRYAAAPVQALLCPPPPPKYPCPSQGGKGAALRANGTITGSRTRNELGRQ